jgi:hypothetical protein
MRRGTLGNAGCIELIAAVIDQVGKIGLRRLWGFEDNVVFSPNTDVEIRVRRITLFRIHRGL